MIYRSNQLVGLLSKKTLASYMQRKLPGFVGDAKGFDPIFQKQTKNVQTHSDTSANHMNW